MMIDRSDDYDDDDDDDYDDDDLSAKDGHCSPSSLGRYGSRN